MVLLLAGCTGTPDTNTTIQETQSIETTEESKEEIEPTTTSIVEEKQNPWKKEIVTVSLAFDEAVDNPERHREILQQEIEFWNANITEYSPHNAEFEYIQQSQNSDVVIDVVPTISTCGEGLSLATYFYCVTPYEEGETESGITEGQVSSRYNYSLTQMYYREFFGVMLGVENTEEIEGVEYYDSQQLRDPWPESNPVVVNVSNQVNESRNFEPIVEESVSYWIDGQGSNYANYSVNISFQPDADNADISVRFVETLGDCGIRPIDTGYIGCAPQYSGNYEANEVTSIDIEGGYTDHSTKQTVIHEFGHVFGRSHGQEPLPEMNATFQAVTLPKTDAVDRERPWKYDRLRVYFDLGSVHSVDVWESEIYDALNYVESGADGSVPDQISFEIVNDPEQADIEIEALDFNNDSATLSRWWGPNPDDDDAIEQYTSMKIVANNEINSRDVGYYISRALISSWIDEYPDAVDDDADIQSAP